MSDAAPPGTKNHGLYPWLRIAFGLAVYAGFIYGMLQGRFSVAEGVGGGLVVAVLAWWALPWIVLILAVLLQFSSPNSDR